MDFFFRSHLQLCVYFTRLNINSKSLFCQKTRRRPAELSSGPINFCLTDELSQLEEAGSNTFAEILSKIEERAFREGLGDCVKCQDTLQAPDWQSQKGESKSESDLAPRSSTRRGRLSAFQSLLAHDKWCWMRSVKRREIRNTELPTENEQFVCKINLWPREIECRGFVVISKQHGAERGRRLWTLRGSAAETHDALAVWLLNDEDRAQCAQDLSAWDWCVHTLAARLCGPSTGLTVRVKQPAETTSVLSQESFRNETCDASVVAIVTLRVDIQGEGMTLSTYSRQV